MKILLLLMSLCAFGSEELARRFAPTIIQELGSSPQFDEFTRVDFDGDWNPNNNWENAEKFPRPPAVYWHLQRNNTETHITYGLFYPRDYSTVCFWIHCHENDFEGLRVTVSKTGKAIKLETLAHHELFIQDQPQNIVVKVERQGHGIYLPDGEEKNTHRYSPADYELRPLSELWKHRQQLFEGEFTYLERSWPSHFGGKKWTFLRWGRARPPWAWEIKGGGAKGSWFFITPEAVKTFDGL